MKSSKSRRLVQAEKEARDWLDHVATELGEVHRPRAYSAFRATMHALRDGLAFDDVMQVAAALPPILRGVLLEGWRPAGASTTASKDRFLGRVAESLLGVARIPPQQAARAVFAVLDRRSARDLPASLDDLRPGGREPAPPPDLAEETRADIRTALEQAQAEGVPPEELPELRDELRKPARPGPARSAQGDILQSSLQKTHGWVRELDEALLFGDPDLTFEALCAVLRALRDRLSRDEAFHLASQLPMALVGFLFDRAPDPAALKERSRGEFLARIAGYMPDRTDVRPEEAARAVFSHLSRRVTEGELEDVRERLPSAVRAMWPSERARSRQQTLGGRESPRRSAPRRSTTRARARKAKREVRAALARARAHGVSEEDLPSLAPRRAGRRRSGKS